PPRGPGEREGAVRPVDAELAVGALGELVVRRRDGDREAFLPLGASEYPPAREQLALVPGVAARRDAALGPETEAEIDVVADAGGQGERGIVVDEAARSREDVKPVHEVELHDAAVGHP